MSQEVFLRGLFSCIFSLGFTWIVFSRYDEEIGSESAEGERQKYLPYLPGNLLPMCLLVLLLLDTVYYGVNQAARLTLAAFFGIFLHISAYYLVLILLLPVLRKHMSARACSMLWMLPNYLYITLQSYMELPGPKIVIVAPGNWVWILFAIWLAGFVIVLFWKTAEHLAFRRCVLKNASPVTDPTILTVWQETTEDARMRKPPCKLFTSPNVNTPLSIGLFRRATKVVLPHRSYSPEELKLILRHEIIHIAREDSWSKFFLVFCTAMCWFNPLMWMAMRKSADDLELSCDETVLLNADQDTRKKYALLLLDTAGDERGFTTCLSASANAMRYRLKSVAQPVKRRSGAIIVGLTFFALCMTSGYVALAYGGSSGADIIYKTGDLEQYHLRSVRLKDDTFTTQYDLSNHQAFHAYLAELTLREFTGNYSFSDSEKDVTYLMDTPEGTLVIVLTDHAIKLVPLYGENPQATCYYLSEGVDWAYIDAIIPAYPALNVYLTEDNDPYGNDFSAGLDVLWENENGNRTLIYDAEFADDEFYGIFGSTPYSKAAFSFSKELAAPYSVLVETWDRSNSYTVTQTDMTQPFVLEIPEYPAHYTVCASFYDQNGNVYEAEFRFEIGDTDSM